VYPVTVRLPTWSAKLPIKLRVNRSCHPFLRWAIQNKGKPLTLEQLCLLDIGSIATVQRRMRKLETLSLVKQRQAHRHSSRPRVAKNFGASAGAVDSPGSLRLSRDGIHNRPGEPVIDREPFVQVGAWHGPHEVVALHDFAARF